MDYTRLNNAFRALRKNGYYAKQNFTCCMSCGFAEAAYEAKDPDKIVFYHQQEARYKEDNELSLAWSGNGYEIAGIFATHGIDVEWNGDDQYKIIIKNYIN